MKKFIFLAFLWVLSPALAWAEPIRILVFGDSLASGFGLPEDDGFSPQLEAALKAAGTNAKVINAGIAGDTTQGALARANFTYSIEHDVVLLEIGANDMLRGAQPQLVKKNLAELVEQSEKPVYLIGIRAIPNYGMAYAREFDAIYAEVSETYETGLYPFIFEKVFDDGVVASTQYFQPDRLHLNKKGVERVTQDIAVKMVKWLETLDQDSILNN